MLTSIVTKLMLVGADLLSFRFGMHFAHKETQWSFFGRKKEAKFLFLKIMIHAHSKLMHTINHNRLFRQVLQKWHTPVCLSSLHLSPAFLQLTFTSSQMDCFSPFLSPRGTERTCLFK